ncbi:hypothetical protein ACJJTC_012246 [Scirpophaga incertulas]
MLKRLPQNKFRSAQAQAAGRQLLSCQVVRGLALATQEQASKWLWAYEIKPGRGRRRGTRAKADTVSVGIQPTRSQLPPASAACERREVARSPLFAADLSIHLIRRP